MREYFKIILEFSEIQKSHDRIVFGDPANDLV